MNFSGQVENSIRKIFNDSLTKARVTAVTHIINYKKIKETLQKSYTYFMNNEIKIARPINTV